MAFWAVSAPCWVVSSHPAAPQFLLDRAVLNLFMSHPLLVPGIILTQVRCLALGPVKPHVIPKASLLDPLQLSIMWMASHSSGVPTAQLGVVSKSAFFIFHNMILVSRLMTPKRHHGKPKRMHLNKLLSGSIQLNIFRQIQNLLNGE